jgi:hypothetical protein
MTTIVVEIYEALKKAGVEEDLARAAARAVIGAEEKEKLVTKADLRAELAELKAELKVDIAELKAEVQAMLNRQLQVMMGLMVAMTGVFAAIVKWF